MAPSACASSSNRRRSSSRSSSRPSATRPSHQSHAHTAAADAEPGGARGQPGHLQGPGGAGAWRAAAALDPGCAQLKLARAPDPCQSTTTSSPYHPSTTPSFTHQVNSLLALDPGNEQYKSLSRDLADATRLTEQLIKAQSGGAGGAGAAAGEAEASAGPTGACQCSRFGAPTGARIHTPTYATPTQIHVIQIPEPLQLRKEPAAATSCEPWTPRVGDRVEAPYGDKRYPGACAWPCLYTPNQRARCPLRRSCRRDTSDSDPVHTPTTNPAPPQP